MSKQLTINRGLHRFNGGIHFADEHAESTRHVIASLPIPDKLILPLKQHIGETCKPVVSVGDQVLKGQLLAESENYISAPIHAPTSGIIIAIADHEVPHPSGLTAPCIVIKTDGEDRWCEREPIPDYRSMDRSHLRNLIRNAGIVGLGGAAFPSSVKLNPGPGRTINTLIVNAAECEPYINCDDMLIRERAVEILHGVDIARYCLKVKQCKIGIEDNMPDAHAALQKAIKETGIEDIKLVVVPTRYPTGGEKQLIKVITGLEVPKDGLPADIGIVCHNVGTLYAIARAILHNEPLLSRVVTVTGKGIKQPRNVEAFFGTPLSELAKFCGGYTHDVSRLLMGGHMMGFALHSDELPLVKAANCLLAGTPDELPEPGKPKPCIRCGMCEQVCPANLLPQQLYWYAKAKEFDKTEEFNLFDCIECGCCAYVCPSEIPLVQYYRYAKAEIATKVRKREKSDIARQRFEFRKVRLEREQQEKAEQMQKRKEALRGSDDNSKQAAIQAALERVKAKKEERAKTQTE
ncbi:MAG: electron transport complex subunit RsxC [Gammaproteobacteria bacterium]|nr:electron transport complex subunit RsxC [Gammaproteobacteria bacterium]